MTDPRPICPIPPDARVGDVVVLRDGQRRKLSSSVNADGDYFLDGDASPLGIHASGKNWLCGDSYLQWDCIAFEYADGRKPNTTRTGKPKRTQAQRDAARIKRSVRAWRVRPISEDERNWLLAIADRLDRKSDDRCTA